MRWHPIVGDHWIYTNESDRPGRISPGSSGPETFTRRGMMQDARQWIGYGWRVVTSSRDTIILECPSQPHSGPSGVPGERRTISIRRCPGPPVCTACRRATAETAERVQRLFDQGVRDVKRSYAGPRRRRARRG